MGKISCIIGVIDLQQKIFIKGGVKRETACQFRRK